MGRTIIIGDVHGCIEEFQDLLDLVSYERGQDRLIQIGDLMDRGPDPVGCVRLAREIGAEVIQGNHENKHVRWRSHEEVRLGRKPPTYKGYGPGKKNPVQGINGVRAEQNMQLTDEEIQWMMGLPLMIHVNPSLVAVHAGLEPAFPIARQSSAVQRVRYVNAAGEMKGFSEGSQDQPAATVFWSTRWCGPESVVYGHAVHSLDAPRVDSFEGGASYGIDTGCVYGGFLTAMLVIDGQAPEFAQVQARQTYYEGWHPQPV